MDDKTNNSLQSDTYPLGERIEQMVDVLGSRATAAEVAGVTTQQLRNLISGRNAPSFLPIAKLAEATGFRLEWIFSGAEPKKKERMAPRIRLPESMVSLPGDPDAEEDLLNEVFDALEPVYARTEWRIDPEVDLFFLDDCKQAIVDALEPLDWSHGVELLAKAHAGALERTGQAAPPLKVPKR